MAERPQGLNVYCTGSQVPCDGFRFVLDMTSAKARKWVTLYDPVLLKMLRFRWYADPRRARSTCCVPYDPDRVGLMMLERSEVFERNGMGYNRGNMENVLVAIGG